MAFVVLNVESSFDDIYRNTFPYDIRSDALQHKLIHSISKCGHIRADEQEQKQMFAIKPETHSIKVVYCYRHVHDSGRMNGN